MPLLPAPDVLRQQIVAAHLFGGVKNVNRMLAMGTMPIGAQMARSDEPLMASSHHQRFSVAGERGWG
jgi:hypothetical protein